VLVKIEHRVCATDIHAAGTAGRSRRRRRSSHYEGVGIVRRVGQRDPACGGDRVAIPWLGWACGHCEYCTGWETLCEHHQNTGYAIDRVGPSMIGSAAYVGKVPRDRSLRGRTADVCGVTCKGGQGPGASLRLGSHLRHGGQHLAMQYARPSPARRWWPSTWSTGNQMAKGWCRVHGQRPRAGPRQRHKELRRGRRDRSPLARRRAGVWIASAGRAHSSSVGLLPKADQAPHFQTVWTDEIVRSIVGRVLIFGRSSKLHAAARPRSCTRLTTGQGHRGGAERA
jgi:hypothetical protein